MSACPALARAFKPVTDSHAAIAQIFKPMESVVTGQLDLFRGRAGEPREARSLRREAVRVDGDEVAEVAVRRRFEVGDSDEDREA